MPRSKRNALGLTLKDYRLAFGGWDVPVSWLSGAFNLDLPIEETKQRVLSWAAGRKVMPKRKRLLSLPNVQRMLQKAVDDSAKKIAARRMTAEARRWLVAAVPSTRVIPAAEILALQGSIDITDSANSPLPHGGSLVGDEPLFVHTETNDDVPRHTEEPEGKVWVYDASEFED